MKKVDFAGQLIMAIIIITFGLTKEFQIIALMSFLILGVWQLMSAITLTIFYRKNASTNFWLKIYWLLIALVFLTSSIAIYLEKPGTSSGFYTMLYASGVCSIYYLAIYYFKLFKEKE